MSSTSYLLSRQSNPEQFTMSRATLDKFIANGILQGQPDINKFLPLNLPANRNLRTAFPNCIFGRIPEKVNTTAFLEYLGTKNETAKKILADTNLRTHGMTDGEALLNQLRFFAQGLGKTLDERFFTADIISDVNRLKHNASQTPGIMNQYLAQSTSNKTIGALTNYDYLSKIFSDRIANLISLDRAIDLYGKN